MSFTWSDRPVLVTGGASFIGSHLVEALLARGAVVSVVDDLSSGSRANLEPSLSRIRFRHDDVTSLNSRASFAGQNIVFHLAAEHGGRGYVDLHQVECARNLGLDSKVFRSCAAAGVERVVYASSGCVYGLDAHAHRERNGNAGAKYPEHYVLAERDAGPPYDADGMYGWAKLMGEMTLQAYAKAGTFKAASCRYFTVYGPRGRENHAVIAMLARAFVRHDPFEIWGDGTQVRNWTHVSDIVEGTISAAEHIEDGTAVNVGTQEAIAVMDAARQACALAGYAPEFRFLPDMPVGPLNRVADNGLAKRALGWAPRVAFADGLRATWEWYQSTHDVETVRLLLRERGALTER